MGDSPENLVLVIRGLLSDLGGISLSGGRYRFDEPGEVGDDPNAVSFLIDEALAELQRLNANPGDTSDATLHELEVEIWTASKALDTYYEDGHADD
jgi:hypothetical protein